MTGESNESVTNVTEPTTSPESGDNQAAMATLQAQVEKQAQLIEKLRLHEQTSLEREKAEKQKREGVEGEIDTLKQEFQSRFDNQAIDAALERELLVAKARNVDVTKRLLDRNGFSVVNGKVDVKQIRDAISALKQTEDYLFASTNSEPVTKPTSTPARAGEGPAEDIVKREMRSAKSVRELQEIIKKHSVGSS